MGEILIADLETNGLLRPTATIPRATKIWMIGVLNFETDDFDCYTGYDPGPRSIMAGIERLLAADLIVGHHIRGYDVPLIEQFTEGLVTFDRDRVIDTLDMSRRLVRMDHHRLEDWGRLLGFPKLPKPDFEAGFTPEMAVYCERDCRLNKMLFEILCAEEAEQQERKARG